MEGEQPVELYYTVLVGVAARTNAWRSMGGEKVNSGGEAKSVKW